MLKFIFEWVLAYKIKTIWPNLMTHSYLCSGTLLVCLDWGNFVRNRGFQLLIKCASFLGIPRRGVDFGEGRIGSEDSCTRTRGKGRG